MIDTTTPRGFIATAPAGSIFQIREEQYLVVRVVIFPYYIKMAMTSDIEGGPITYPAEMFLDVEAEEMKIILIAEENEDAKE